MPVVLFIFVSTANVLTSMPQSGGAGEESAGDEQGEHCHTLLRGHQVGNAHAYLQGRSRRSAWSQRYHTITCLTISCLATLRPLAQGNEGIIGIY